MYLKNIAIEDICFFSVKDRNLFHCVDTIGNIFTSGPDEINSQDEINFDLSQKKNQQIFCLFHAFKPFWKKLYQNPVQFFSVIPMAYPFRIATYYNITSSVRNLR